MDFGLQFMLLLLYGTQSFCCAILLNKIRFDKQQFIHLLTAAFKDLHIKNSKNHKKVILPASRH